MNETVPSEAAVDNPVSVEIDLSRVALPQRVIELRFVIMREMLKLKTSESPRKGEA